jgi:uncharacterized protein YkwD
MDRGTRNASQSARRTWILLSGVVVLAVVAGGGTYLARDGFSSSPASGQAAAGPPATAAGCGAADIAACGASPDDIAVAVAPAVVTVPPRQAAARAHQTTARPARSPSPSASSRLSSHPAAPATGPGGGKTATSAAPSAPAGAPTAAQGGTAAAQVLALINQARSGAGLAPLTVTSGLQASSSAHNLKMAGGCGLSHQCPGEPAIGDRETAAGVHWTAAGENIGEGGPVADTDSAIAQMAVGLTQSMLDEQPPNDGHRKNILSTSFTHIGIAVYRDGSGTVWLTQDFSN